jgi:WD40 repeat protein
VCWYPHDAGLFVSAGYDGLVRLWDADALRPALDFDLAGRAYSLHLSARARSHGLVAVGSEEAAVRYERGGVDGVPPRRARARVYVP